MNDINKNKVILRRIGKCPICGKGQMLKGTAGWTCDYFKNINDKCTFTIYSSYYGYELTEDDAIALIENGITEKRTFKTLSGNYFDGYLYLDENKIKVKNDNELMTISCPNCGGKMYKTRKGYTCENFLNNKKCNVFIPIRILNRDISLNEAEQILEFCKSEVLDGFIHENRKFSSILVFNEEWNLILDGQICKCPKCNGIIYPGEKAYNCSNFRNPEIKCDFTIWREIAKRKITVMDVITLCRHEITGCYTFYTKDNKPYQRQMILSNDNKVKLI